MAENEVSIIVKADDQTARGFGSAQRRSEGFAKSLGGVAKAGAAIAATAVVAGVVKLTQFMGDSVEAASNLGESMNAVSQIFDESAKSVLDWGKNNANSFGLSQRAFNELATPLGAMLKNAGLSMKDTSKWTIDLTKRAADLASVFNTDVSTAMEAIQAGLRGESDPLEQFGIGLSAAAVQAQALADTGKKTASSLTDQEKATARLNLIMKQSSDSAGDFQKTSDGLANSQRILAARTEDAQAQIGQKMLPMVLKWTQLKLALVDTITNKVLPAIEAFTAREDVQEFLQRINTVIQNQVIPALQNFWNWFSTKIIPLLINLYQTHIKNVLNAFSGLRKTINDNRAGLQTLGIWIARAAEFFLKYLAPAISKIYAVYLKSLVTQIRVAIVVIASLVTAVSKTVGAIRRNFSGVYGAITNPVRNAVSAINSWLGGVIGKINSVKNAASHALSFLPGRATGGVIGAAGGGPRGGLTMVGEQGRELVRLPAGSSVINNNRTEQMMSGGSGGSGQPIQVNLELDGRQVASILIDPLRREVKRLGGSVEKALGTA